ncbi:predicted protein [Lichtheimia corymbifera JMRC:FSU:9682]|uniref:Uncharacterized protein n=1 Tax=Lichtheimia corymbifera JMRC:FSU:9682 TaxID=1263082 RepID=A0A068RWJ4_9FUNG|nr:predicted protein [Lichtheimia corymbifera JMRC:FSU:9682]
MRYSCIHLLFSSIAHIASSTLDVLIQTSVPLDGSFVVVGFKADARVIVDAGGKKFDMGAMEVAKGDFDKKIIKEKGKLIRDSKGNTDELCMTLAHNGINSAYFFRTTVANLQISTCHLASDGLHNVVLPRFNFDLPGSIDEFSKFYDALEMNLTVKVNMKYRDHHTTKVASCINIANLSGALTTPNWMTACYGLETHGTPRIARHSTQPYLLTSSDTRTTSPLKRCLLMRMTMMKTPCQLRENILMTMDIEEPRVAGSTSMQRRTDRHPLYEEELVRNHHLE